MGMNPNVQVEGLQWFVNLINSI